MLKTISGVEQRTINGVKKTSSAAKRTSNAAPQTSANGPSPSVSLTGCGTRTRKRRRSGGRQPVGRVGTVRARWAVGGVRVQGRRGGGRRILRVRSRWVPVGGRR